MSIPKFTCEIEINIEQHQSGHFVYQILLDGFPQETNEAASASAALRAGAHWLNRKCKKCGCTFLNGCYSGDDFTGEYCHWVKPDLCSHCVPKKKEKKSSKS
jgi:hypothetical protein